MKIELPRSHSMDVVESLPDDPNNALLAVGYDRDLNTASMLICDVPI